MFEFLIWSNIKRERALNRVPEIIFWHIPSQAYKTVAPRFYAHRKCIGSMFVEKVASQEAEMGMMKLLEGRSSVKVNDCRAQFSIFYVLPSASISG